MTYQRSRGSWRSGAAPQVMLTCRTRSRGRQQLPGASSASAYMENPWSTLELFPLPPSPLSWKGKAAGCVDVAYAVLRDPPKGVLSGSSSPGLSWWKMLRESWWILPSPCPSSLSPGTVDVVLEEEGRGKGEGLRNNLSSIPPCIQQAAGSNWVRTWSTSPRLMRFDNQ